MLVNQAIVVEVKLSILGDWNECASPSVVGLVTDYTTEVELLCMITMLDEDL